MSRVHISASVLMLFLFMQGVLARLRSLPDAAPRLCLSLVSSGLHQISSPRKPLQQTLRGTPVERVRDFGLYD